MANAGITVSSNTVLAGSGTIKFNDGEVIWVNRGTEDARELKFDLTGLTRGGAPITFVNYTNGVFLAPAVLENLESPATQAISGRHITDDGKYIRWSPPDGSVFVVR